MTKRKSILASFAAFAAPEEQGGSSTAGPEVAHPLPRVGAGVIGATQRSLSELREERDRLQAQVDAGGASEIDPDLIDPSPFPDRLPDDGSEDFEAFKKLIADEGQKVPIEVRRHPDQPERYQVVYGHRRWRAAKELGLRVKAIVLNLSDPELVMAQGIENAARQDLTWIERALFAWRMDEAGIKPRDIRAALVIDDPELARFRAVTRVMPPDLIQAIGRAPKVGRPRWIEFAGLLAADERAIGRVRETLSAAKVSSSDQRFREALAAVKQPAISGAGEADILGRNGKIVGKAIFSERNIKLTMEKSQAADFAEFLRDELPDLMDRFYARKGGT